MKTKMAIPITTSFHHEDDDIQLDNILSNTNKYVIGPAGRGWRDRLALDDRHHHLGGPVSFKMLHTASSGQRTGKASKGASLNGVSVIIFGVTIIFKVLWASNEYRLSVVPPNIDPS